MSSTPSTMNSTSARETNPAASCTAGAPGRLRARPGPWMGGPGAHWAARWCRPRQVAPAGTAGAALTHPPAWRPCGPRRGSKSGTPPKTS
eukprot:1421183-Pyramimonas_sp.AAC.1